MDKKLSLSEKIRHWVQGLFALTTNGHLSDFVTGLICKGPGEHLRASGMNCHPRPGAYGSCLIGPLQAVMGSYKYSFPYYVLGVIFFFGALSGRLVCGFLYPFGLVQDLLHKIPPKKIKTFRGGFWLRKAKYLISLVFVLILPLFVIDFLGQGAPSSCKYPRPVGTLGGGLFLVFFRPTMWSAIGWLYLWKSLILILVTVASVLIYRPSRKYMCPLGAVHSFLNRHALFSYHVDLASCVYCGAYARACQMNIHPTGNINDSEYICYGRCKSACPKPCIDRGFFLKEKSPQK